MVGPVRFELTTSCTPCKRATRLRYGPNRRKGEQAGCGASKQAVFFPVSAGVRRGIFAWIWRREWLPLGALSAAIAITPTPSPVPPRSRWIWPVLLAVTICIASGRGQVAAPDIVDIDKVGHALVFGLLGT